MKSLARTVVREGSRGVPLPTVIPGWESNKWRFWRGELNMIAGHPGAGKTMLAMFLAYSWKLPTLYFLADSSEHTAAVRLLSLATGWRQDDAADIIATRPGYAQSELQAAEHIRWCFDAELSPYVIGLEVAAYAELQGQPPAVVVVDNLMDVSEDGGAHDRGTFNQILRELKIMGREHDIAFVVLHHMSESVPARPVPPRAALMEKVGQIPAVIASVHVHDDGRMAAAWVKNRGGPSDPTGQSARWLRTDLSRMRIAEDRPLYY